MSAGVGGWTLVSFLALDPTWPNRARLVITSLLILAGFTVLGSVASRRALGVPWGTAVLGLLGVAVASFSSGASDLLLRTLYDGSERSSVLTLVAPVLLCSLVMSAALLRSGNNVIAHRVAVPIGCAVMRALAVAAATLVGVVLLDIAGMAATEMLRGVFQIPMLEASAWELVLGLVALAVVLRPARLRPGDGLVLLGAGLAAVPLLALVGEAMLGARPTRTTAGYVVAVTVGIGVAVLAARPRSRQETTAEEPPLFAGPADRSRPGRWAAPMAAAVVLLLVAGTILVSRALAEWRVQPAATTVSPAPASPPALPAGFLTVADLGTGWSQGDLPGDNGAASEASVPGGADCAGVSLPTAAPGHQVVFRGHQPLGDGEWLLNEQLIELTPAGTDKAKAALEHAAAGCPDQSVLFGGTGIAGDYALALRFSTATGAATAWAVAGNRLIVLTTLPGGASGQHVPLPGGTTWLEQVTRTAARRAVSG